MKTLKQLIEQFGLLIEKIKEDSISIENALVESKGLLNDFEKLSNNDVSIIFELKKEFEKVINRMNKLKKIEKNIKKLEEAIKFYNERLDTL